MKQRLFFKKEERLNSQKTIDLLFRERVSSLYIFPLRLTWVKTPLITSFPAQVLIIVPKKKFRNASDRNRIKRQLREAYRKNKQLIYDGLTSENDKFALSLTYVSDQYTESAKIDEALERLVQRFLASLN